LMRLILRGWTELSTQIVYFQSLKLPRSEGVSMRTVCVVSVLVLSILCGCSAQQAKPAATAPDFKPTFPIEEVMGHIVMPSADKLWGSVATTVSAKGIEETVPKTDEDWERVRDYAVTLVEATNLLLIPGRRVAEQGKTQADKSELPPEQ